MVDLVEWQLCKKDKFVMCKRADKSISRQHSNYIQIQQNDIFAVKFARAIQKGVEFVFCDNYVHVNDKSN